MSRGDGRLLGNDQGLGQGLEAQAVEAGTQRTGYYPSGSPACDPGVHARPAIRHAAASGRPASGATRARELELGQLGGHGVRRQPGALDEGIDVDRIVAQRRQHRAVPADGSGRRRSATGAAAARQAAAPPGRPAPFRRAWRRRGSACGSRATAASGWIRGSRRPRVPVRRRRRAVMSEPEDSAASTTSTPRARPLMSRLRRGKFQARAAACRAGIRTACRRARRSHAPGRVAARDRPGRARCRSRRSSMPRRRARPRWAAPSMPSARPDTIVSPASASARANARALSMPCGGGVAAADDGQRRTH